jgi:putative sterol carrier protein
MESKTEVPVSERLEALFAAFAEHGAPGTPGQASYLFDLTGAHGGRHLLRIDSGTASWDADDDGSADVTIRLSTEDLLAIADGRMDGRFAVSSERIEIEGDLDKAAGMIGHFRELLATD